MDSPFDSPADYQARLILGDPVAVAYKELGELAEEISEATTPPIKVTPSLLADLVAERLAHCMEGKYRYIGIRSWASPSVNYAEVWSLVSRVYGTPNTPSHERELFVVEPERASGRTKRHALKLLHECLDNPGKRIIVQDHYNHESASRSLALTVQRLASALDVKITLSEYLDISTQSRMFSIIFTPPARSYVKCPTTSTSAIPVLFKRSCL